VEADGQVRSAAELWLVVRQTASEAVTLSAYEVKTRHSTARCNRHAAGVHVARPEAEQAWACVAAAAAAAGGVPALSGQSCSSSPARPQHY
jgi:hypothetical protein